MNRIEIEKALINIFKEDGREVKSITTDTVTVVGLRETTYTYTVDKDLITIANKRGITEFEKYISSYQDLNVSVTID